MPQNPPRQTILLAFAAIYFIWGSTFLAIAIAIETIPPFLMAGIRFLIAGIALYAWGRFREGERPEATHWRTAAIVGLLLLVGGNGAVAFAEQHVPSGWTALAIAATPMWMVLLEWARPGGLGPTPRIVLGIILGFTGLVVLVGPAGLLGGTGFHRPSALVLLIGTICWASGSIASRGLPMPRSARLATGMQMLAGGVVLIALAFISGETARFDVAAVSQRSLLALIYLILFGAIIGFTAYTWLLGVSAPARVSTYAYVNPLVALFLGWWIAGEPLEPRIFLAAAIILGAIALISIGRSGGAPARKTA